MAETVLVLGAGLGKEYGFPYGPELRRLIITLLRDRETELREIVKWEPSETVDELAAKHPKYIARIREIVVQVLRERENEASLRRFDVPNTYMLMLKQIAAAKSQGDTVQILTFNYDRSLLFLIHKVNAISDQKNALDPSTFHSLGMLLFQNCTPG